MLRVVPRKRLLVLAVLSWGRFIDAPRGRVLVRLQRLAGETGSPSSPFYEIKVAGIARDGHNGVATRSLLAGCPARRSHLSSPRTDKSVEDVRRHLLDAWVRQRRSGTIIQRHTPGNRSGAENPSSARRLIDG
jgi:hypothetical protein